MFNIANRSKYRQSRKITAARFVDMPLLLHWVKVNFLQRPLTGLPAGAMLISGDGIGRNYGTRAQLDRLT
jgi:hypothetical protein